IAAELGRDELRTAILGFSDYRPGARTLFVAEGLLMYLKEPAVDAIFHFAASLSGPGSGIAFTFMEPGPDGRACFKNASQLLDLWLRWRGEPFRWGIRHEHLPAFLERHGFSLAEIATPEGLRARYLAALGFGGEP